MGETQPLMFGIGKNSGNGFPGIACLRPASGFYSEKPAGPKP